MRVKIVNFINNYQAKWFCADFIFISDTLANGVWGSKYYEIFATFGLKPAAVNTVISILELIRLGVLLYQRAIEREAESVKSCTLHHEKNLSDDK